MVVLRLVLLFGPSTFSQSRLREVRVARLPVHQPVDLTAVHLERVEVVRQCLELLGLGGRGRREQERDEVGVAGGDVERLHGQDLAQLGRGADERRHLEADVGLDRLADGPLQVGSTAGGVEHDVAAVDVGPDVRVAELLEQLDQAGVHDASLAEVHGSEEGDVSGHAGHGAAPAARWAEHVADSTRTSRRYGCRVRRSRAYDPSSGASGGSLGLNLKRLLGRQADREQRAGASGARQAHGPRGLRLRRHLVDRLRDRGDPVRPARRGHVPPDARVPRADGDRVRVPAGRRLGVLPADDLRLPRRRRRLRRQPGEHQPDRRPRRRSLAARRLHAHRRGVGVVGRAGHRLRLPLQRQRVAARRAWRSASSPCSRSGTSGV